MAFLLIVQVPFEQLERNKLEEEIQAKSEQKSKSKAKEPQSSDTDETEESDTESDVERDSKAEDSDITSSIDEGEVASNDQSKDTKTDGDNKEIVRKESTDLTESDTTETPNREDSPDIISSATDDSAKIEEQTKSETQATETPDEGGNDKEQETGVESVKVEDESLETKSEATADQDKDKDENKDEGKVDDNKAAEDKVEKSEDIKTETAEGENGENNDGDLDEQEEKYTDLTPLLPTLPLHKLVEDALFSLEVNNFDTKKVGDGTYIKFSFVQQDSQRCEVILNKLKALGVGSKEGSFVSVFPASLHESPEESVQDSPVKGEVVSEEFQQKESQFKKSIKSRLVVAQVVASVKSNAQFTFDYLLLLILASLIACLGLVENSSVILVASMLISPLMGPILAGTFGQVIKMAELRNLGVKSELAGLLICLIVGFGFGLISGGIGLHGAVWGSTDSWPTAEMKSRGLLRSLWVGVLIALPSGAGVAISVLGGNAGSLVGVAISASLLPPACNAGVLWAYALLAAISPPEVVQTIAAVTTTLPPVNITSTLNTTTSGLPSSSSTSLPVTVTPSSPAISVPESCAPLVDNAYRQVYSCDVAQDAAVLGLISLLLTLLNITCILIMGIIVLKIKEVAPKTAGSTTSSLDHFWQEDIQVARTYYQTSKGKQSAALGREFLDEWEKIKDQEKQKLDKISEEEGGEKDSDSLAGNVAMINLVHYITDVEQSPGIKHVLSRLSPATPPELISVGLSSAYNRATTDIEFKLSQRPAVYLAEPKVKDDLVHNAYHTIHGSTSNNKQHRPTLRELRNRLERPTRSAYFDTATLDMINEEDAKPAGTNSATGLVHPSSSGLWKRRKKVKFEKFEVVKVEEQSLLA